MDEKRKLRAEMRDLRRAYAAELPDETRALVFLRPPLPIVELAPEDAVVGLYFAVDAEAPTLPYAKWFHENGWRLALPWFAARGDAMAYRQWRDPWDESLLEPGPFGALQPRRDANMLTPALAFVPVVAFTPDGHRLGQGGGHYDRWHAAHPQIPAVGLAWDCQCCDDLPIEPHDHPLDAVVTQTRLYQVT